MLFSFSIVSHIFDYFVFELLNQKYCSKLLTDHAFSISFVHSLLFKRKSNKKKRRIYSAAFVKQPLWVCQRNANWKLLSTFVNFDINTSTKTMQAKIHSTKSETGEPKPKTKSHSKKSFHCNEIWFRNQIASNEIDFIAKIHLEMVAKRKSSDKCSGVQRRMHREWASERECESNAIIVGDLSQFQLNCGEEWVWMACTRAREIAKLQFYVCDAHTSASHPLAMAWHQIESNHTQSHFTFSTRIRRRHRRTERKKESD